MSQSGAIAAVAAALVTVFGYAVHCMSQGRSFRERLTLIPAAWVPFGMFAALAFQGISTDAIRDANAAQQAHERKTAQRFLDLMAYERERASRQ